MHFSVNIHFTAFINVLQKLLSSILIWEWAFYNLFNSSKGPFISQSKTDMLHGWILSLLFEFFSSSWVWSSTFWRTVHQVAYWKFISRSSSCNICPFVSSSLSPDWNQVVLRSPLHDFRADVMIRLVKQKKKKNSLSAGPACLCDIDELLWGSQ